MVASKVKPKNVQVVAKIMYSWNQLIEQIWQTSKLHKEGSFGYESNVGLTLLAIPVTYLKSFLPEKAGPGTTRLAKRLGCSSGICLGYPWMLTWDTSNFESVTSSTVAI